MAVPDVHDLSNFGYPYQSKSMMETYSPDCVNASDTLLNQLDKVGIIKIRKKLKCLLMKNVIIVIHIVFS